MHTRAHRRRPAARALWAAAALAAGALPAAGTGGCGRKAVELGVGDDFTTKLRRSDMTTPELTEAYGWSEGELQGVMNTAKPDNCVDAMSQPIPCYEFSRFDCRWLAVAVDDPGMAVVRATGTRDYMMICVAPDGVTTFGNDDFDTNACVNNGECDPGLLLDGAGTWTCFFTVSPYDTVFYDPNDPVGGQITVQVTAS
ncbi:MAG TPA: hypothetical protein VG389_19825 [Myxococcota bacterium]|nr:hypothetical protein [Myxococcota bacterium]